MIAGELDMRHVIMISAACLALSACSTVAKTTGKAVALPFEATYHTGKAVGKGVVGTTKFAGKTAFATGKGVYYVGSVPVKITDKALDTSSKMLRVTTQMVDLTGKVVTVSRNIQAAQLESELIKYQGATNVLGVTIDALV